MIGSNLTVLCYKSQDRMAVFVPVSADVMLLIVTSFEKVDISLRFKCLLF
jgi:hypothetical protein